MRSLRRTVENNVFIIREVVNDFFKGSDDLLTKARSRRPLAFVGTRSTRCWNTELILDDASLTRALTRCVRFNVVSRFGRVGRVRLTSRMRRATRTNRVGSILVISSATTDVALIASGFIIEAIEVILFFSRLIVISDLRVVRGREVGDNGKHETPIVRRNVIKLMSEIFVHGSLICDVYARRRQKLWVNRHLLLDAYDVKVGPGVDHSEGKDFVTIYITRAHVGQATKTKSPKFKFLTSLMDKLVGKTVSTRRPKSDVAHIRWSTNPHRTARIPKNSKHPPAKDCLD
jgi:hypothetical protein